MSIQEPLQDVGNNQYEISKHHMVLSHISGLKNNAFYTLTFNDYSLSFYSDDQGVLVFSDKFQVLPVGCLYYSDILIKDRFSKNILKSPPIGHYSNSPKYHFPCDKMTLTLTLAELPAYTHMVKYVQRQAVIEDGSIALLPQVESYSNSNYIGVY